MLKKTITYKDFNDVERTEDFYFNLTEAELMEMELGVTGGMTEMIQRLVSTQDGPAIAKMFKDLVLKAYGQKSLDGKRFIKNDTLREEFEQTNAYSQLYMKLATDADEAAKFMKGIIPANLSEQANSSIPAPALKK